MNSVWMIGLAMPAAMIAATVVAFVRNHPQRRAIALGTIFGAGFGVTSWLFARAIVADPNRVGEPLFLQLAFSTLAIFVFAVAAMVGGRLFPAR